MFVLSLNKTTWFRLLVCFSLSAGLLATGVSVLPALAQPPSVKKKTPQQYWWVNGGFGTSRTGIGATATGGVPVGNRLFVGGRYVRTEEFNLLGTDPRTNWDAGLLVGLVEQGRYGHISLGSGVGLVGGQRPDERGTKSSTLGIPLDVQAFFTPIRYLGIGVHGYANVNPDENVLGVSLQLQVRISQ